MTGNGKPKVDRLYSWIVNIERLSVILGIGSHSVVFYRFTKIYDERVLEYIGNQFVIFCMQFILIILSTALVAKLYVLREEKLAIIFTYAILGLAVLPPIVYIIILNPK